MPPRIEVQSWRYIGADPIDDEANDYRKDQSWPTIMQLNKALDILDKKEEALEEHCYPQTSAKQTDDGFGSMSQTSTCFTRGSPRGLQYDKSCEMEID